MLEANLNHKIQNFPEQNLNHEEGISSHCSFIFQVWHSGKLHKYFVHLDLYTSCSYLFIGRLDGEM